jgi:hypothetical protein
MNKAKDVCKRILEIEPDNHHFQRCMLSLTGANPKTVKPSSIPDNQLTDPSAKAVQSEASQKAKEKCSRRRPLNRVEDAAVIGSCQQDRTESKTRETWISQSSKQERPLTQKQKEELEHKHALAELDAFVKEKQRVERLRLEVDKVAERKRRNKPIESISSSSSAAAAAAAVTTSISPPTSSPADNIDCKTRLNRNEGRLKQKRIHWNKENAPSDKQSIRKSFMGLVTHTVSEPELLLSTSCRPFTLSSLTLIALESFDLGSFRSSVSCSSLPSKMIHHNSL